MVRTAVADAARPLQVEYRAKIFSDNASLPIFTTNGNPVTPMALADMPDPAAAGGRFLAADDRWFIDTQQVRPRDCAADAL